MNDPPTSSSVSNVAAARSARFAVECPLAKLGRLSPPGGTSYDNNDRHMPVASSRVRKPYDPRLNITSSHYTDPYVANYLASSSQYSKSDGLCNGARLVYDEGLRDKILENFLAHKQRQSSSAAKYPFDASGKVSPCLDQGYDTLLSQSPVDWAATNAGGVVKRRLPNHFDELPDDVLLNLFSWLGTKDLLSVSRVCRRFHNLAWDSSLWKSISLNGDRVNADEAIGSITDRLCGAAYGKTTTNTRCPEIRQIFVCEGARLSSLGLDIIAKRCPELTHIQLQNCQNITNKCVKHLMYFCPKIRHLDLTGCALVNCVDTVQCNPELSTKFLIQYLDLTDCISLQDSGLRIILKNCPQLIYLYLRRCSQITDSGIKFIPSFCSSLRELSVSDCVKITDFALYELADLGSNLRYLSVAKCTQVSDAGLKVIARRCYKLRYLNARGCEAVSDDAIVVLAQSCSRLRSLDFGKCDVSDVGLRALAESCPNLKKLSLRSCDLITNEGIQAIAYYCRGLQLLNIQDCQITIEGYRAVKRFCKRCIIEHTNPGFC